jgi:4-amino-4-deoxychorismate lyase
MYFCAVNGTATSQVSCLDRGLAFGDGTFTTAKIVNGEICWLSAHLHRLSRACQALLIAPPDMNKLSIYLQQQARPYALAVLKVIITSGIGGRGYARASNMAATTVVTISEFPTHYLTWQQQGIRLGISEQRLSVGPMLAGIKHLNRLEQVLIKQELASTTFDDLLVANYHGYMLETSCANVFWWQDEQLCTADVSESGINGLVRQRILQQYPDIKQVNLTHAQIPQVQAMFICNSLMGIIAVNQLADCALAIQKVQQFSALYVE